MSITSVSTATTSTATSSTAVQQTQDTPATQLANAKRDLNMQILEASAQVSVGSGNNSQALLFRSAIDHINDLLEPELGTNAIQSAASSQDNSAEATAQRIVSLSTAFYDAYAAQHPGENASDLAKKFVDTIRSGFQQGYGEATDVLKGLNTFTGDVQSGVQKTYDLVQKGYDDFLASKLSALSGSSQNNDSAQETSNA